MTRIYSAFWGSHKAGSYKCQLDEQWFNLTQDTLRDALQITPVDNNWAFSSPPTPDTLDFSFGDQFLNDKLYEADDEKTTADTEAESMVPDSPNVHWPLPTTTTTTAATTTTTLPLPPQPQQGPSDPILIKRIGGRKSSSGNTSRQAGEQDQ
ncbi:hypothetical protein Tco_0253591 [Tanacetum coccineum]